MIAPNTLDTDELGMVLRLEADMGEAPPEPAPSDALLQRQLEAARHELALARIDAARFERLEAELAAARAELAAARREVDRQLARADMAQLERVPQTTAEILQAARERGRAREAEQWKR